MRVVHPKTKNVLLMTEDCPFIAEVEANQENPEYSTVVIGHIGYSNPNIEIYRDDWNAFMGLVKLIDLEMQYDMSAKGDLI